jgi:hypothetical protein
MSRRSHLALLDGGSGECKSSKREHERNVDGKGAHDGGKEEEEGTSIEQLKVKSCPSKKCVRGTCLHVCFRASHCDFGFGFSFDWCDYDSGGVSRCENGE